MDRELVAWLLILLFFTAALGFSTYSWWTRDPRVMRRSILYFVIFWLAGWATLVLWVVTDS